MANYTVTNLNDSGDGSLRQAISNANANTSDELDTITFDSSLSGTISLTSGELKITDDVYLDGLGSDYLTIDGNRNSRVFDIDDSTDTVINVTLEGLTITGGSTSGNGGGIYNRERLTLLNSKISNNSGAYWGGGIFGAESATITNSTISNNSAGVGGGIYRAESATITNSTISNNSAVADGGGIFGAQSAVITNSTISNNSAGMGGGIYRAQSAVITNSTISNNSTANYGGGIFEAQSAVITNSTISNNSARMGGGIYRAESATITNSTISNNNASDSGGGIFGVPRAIITNSTISNNSARMGGGIFGTISATITNSTISNNSASDSGGGIRAAYSAVIGNSIIAGNTATTDADIYNYMSLGNITSQGHNLVGSGDISDFNQTGDITGVVNPGLGALQDNGGPTFTHALKPDSLAINGGSNALIPSGVIYDQRGAGFSRIINGIVDIGAFESTLNTSSNPFQVTNTNDSGLGSLRQAILNANATNGAQTITFMDSLIGTTITLTSGELTITDAVYINGLGASNLTIDGNLNSRVFNINDGTSTVIDVTLEGLTISNGSISNNGGGIYNQENLILENSHISHNYAYFNGGGILSLQGTLTVENSTISDNSARNSGGIFNEAGTLTIENSTISDNFARYGGGILNETGTLTIENSTISGNLARYGGGILNNTGTLTIENSTITNNFAYNNGGGIYLGFVNNYNNIVNIANTIIAGNTATNKSDLAVSTNSNITSLGYNLIGNGDIDAFNQLGDLTGINDPGLEALADNGGNTLTHALKPDSLAINGGSNALIPSGVIYDQRGAGFSRIINGIVDIGAFESSLSNQSPITNLKSNLITENSAAGVVVGRFQSQGTPTESKDIVYTLVDGEGSTNNDLFQIIDNQLYTNQELDLEASDTLSIRVQTTNGNQTLESTFTINIIDNNRLFRGFNQIFGTLNEDDLLGTSQADSIQGALGNDSIEGLIGSDRIFGNKGNDTLSGGRDNDTLAGGGGRDLLLGGQGNDKLVGGSDNDRLFGNSGDDLMQGGTGTDYLYGQEGNDLLDGGKGNDFLKGKEGSDTFVLRSGDGSDYVDDFTSGEDLLGLADGLTFDELSFNSLSSGTQIIETATTEILAFLNNVTSVDAGDFVILS